ncbi:Visual system homeobox like [Actinidia chinensis var. chinensis]|uniref:Visual system homeobox like n=1 Tax=Actinidia chinensis var. chinensis TaxID=1590841 RepID=A0A2R6P688_ACTCC|nr:Visual system homeobox like [Actinidia chinensis var. chinensis]
MEFRGRPNRSDTHVSKEQEAKTEEETREYFDGLAPKRHTKPQRSEHSSKYVDDHIVLPNCHDNNGAIPEYFVFQQLEHDSQKMVYNGSEVTEEFVETEYYKDLNCMDKQHHTTGTGFIKMENANGMCFTLTHDAPSGCHGPRKANPATNDWIPAPNDMVEFVSDKPSRSDN